MLSYVSFNVYSAFICTATVLRQMKKILVELMNRYFITWSINRCDFVRWQVLFLTRVICQTVLVLFVFVFISLLNYLGEIFENASWITSIYLTVCWKELYTYCIIDSNIRMFIFWLFRNSINITLTWCINQFVVLNNFSFFYLINFFYLSAPLICLSNLESSVTFYLISEFLSLVVFWMLWVLVTINKLNHMARHGSQALQIKANRSFLTEFFFSVSIKKCPLLVTCVLSDNL